MTPARWWMPKPDVPLRRLVKWARAWWTFKTADRG
jgi:hypothetical protein